VNYNLALAGLSRLLFRGKSVLGVDLVRRRAQRFCNGGASTKEDTNAIAVWIQPIGLADRLTEDRFPVRAAGVKRVILALVRSIGSPFESTIQQRQIRRRQVVFGWSLIGRFTGAIELQREYLR